MSSKYLNYPDVLKSHCPKLWHNQSAFLPSFFAVMKVHCWLYTVDFIHYYMCIRNMERNVVESTKSMLCFGVNNDFIKKVDECSLVFQCWLYSTGDYPCVLLYYGITNKHRTFQ